MISIQKIVFRALFLFMFSIVCSVLSAYGQSDCYRSDATYKACCIRDGGVPYTNSQGKLDCKAKSSPTNNTSSDDSGVRARQEEERRRAEQAAAEEAERQRQAAEAKAKREAEERQRAFEKERDETLKLLRGGGSTDTEIRGVTPTGDEIRGSGNQDTGMRGTSPSSDPMVVVTTNIPSKLPKSVDDAIPHTPAGERIRKGYQAIQKGDWKVARAWFRDALKLEPRNPGIKRLVDLSEFTLYYRAKSENPATTPAKGKQTLNQKQGNEGKVVFLERIAAEQRAMTARMEAAYRKYEQKYGNRRYSAERHRAATAAANGEGYTDAELKEQLHKALLEIRRMRKGKRYADSVEGSPTAEEITLGGKG